MTFEMYALAAVASYALVGVVYSSGVRCWWRGYHNDIRMFIDVSGNDRKLLVDSCKWCLYRRPAIRG